MHVCVCACVIVFIFRSHKAASYQVTGENIYGRKSMAGSLTRITFQVEPNILLEENLKGADSPILSAEKACQYASGEKRIHKYPKIKS